MTTENRDFGYGLEVRLKDDVVTMIQLNADGVPGYSSSIGSDAWKRRLPEKPKLESYLLALLISSHLQPEPRPLMKDDYGSRIFHAKIEGDAGAITLTYGAPEDEGFLVYTRQSWDNIAQCLTEGLSFGLQQIASQFLSLLTSRETRVQNL